MKFTKSRIILIVLAVSVVLFSQASCQEQSAVPQQSKPTLKQAEPSIAPAKAKVAEPVNEPNGPKVEFENIVHDFGKIGPKTKHSCNFMFKNTGDGILKIGKIKSTCGCTVPKLQKKEYLPGETGSIKVRYNANSHPGKVSKKLYIPSNDKKNSNVMLTIKANVELKVAYEPKKLKLLLTEENAGCPEIKIESLDGKEFAIKRVVSTANCITAEFNPNVNANEFVLQPKVDTEKLKKSLNGFVTITVSHPQTKTLTIRFEALPRFKVWPSSINVLNAVPCKSTTREIWILNNYDEDFEIESMSSKKGYVKVLHHEKVVTEEEPKGRHKIDIEITPPESEASRRVFSDLFTVKIKDGEKLEINCHGFYAKNKTRR